MNWFKKVRSILGYFWCEFWEDSWLVELIVKIYQFIVGQSIESRLQQICTQTSVFSQIDPEYKYPIKVLLARYPHTNIQDISGFDIGQDSIGQSDSGFLYDVYSPLSSDSSQLIGFKTSVQNEITDFEFRYYADSRKLFSSIDLQKSGFKASLQNVNGQPTECLVLWAQYKQYDTLRDNFSWALQLPIDWLYKYPDIMATAWKIKHTGATVQLVKEFFQCMGISSQVYMGIKTGLPGASKIPGIYVQTWAGYVYADNSSSNSLISDSCFADITFSDSAFGAGIIPLKTAPGGEISTDYINSCRKRANCNIYAKIPKKLNPAKYIFQRLWGASAGLVILTGTGDEQDIYTAVRFIAKNVVKGAILQIYSRVKGKVALLYPELIEWSDSYSSSSGQQSSSSEPGTDIYVFASMPEGDNWRLLYQAVPHFYVMENKNASDVLRISDERESDSWSVVYQTWPHFYVVQDMNATPVFPGYDVNDLRVCTIFTQEDLQDWQVIYSSIQHSYVMRSKGDSGVVGVFEAPQSSNSWAMVYQSIPNFYVLHRRKQQ